MGNSLRKLVDISSESINKQKPKFDDNIYLAGSLENELKSLLSLKNGFYAFESALHVFPSHTFKNEIGLVDWNKKNLWKYSYNYILDDCLCFAEDIFGGQFCIKDNKIHILDPETGDLEFLANHLEDWAKILLLDYHHLTGYTLAKEWQECYGPLHSGERLLPKKLFVAGGKFIIDNLYICD